jgi:hypothetical protein
MKGADLSQPFNFQMEPQKSGEIIPDKITSILGQARLAITVNLNRR